MGGQTLFIGARHARRAAGAVVVDGLQVADTLQCCHGGEHWVHQPGSGRRRGFCLNCKKPTCGKPACDPCVPFEEKLSLYERGRLKVL